jgi:type II secretion system protein F
MAVYEYEGYDSQGNRKTGALTAGDLSIATQQLKNQGIIISKIHEGKGDEQSGGFGREIKMAEMFTHVSKAEISILTRQLATLIGAKLPVVESLSALTEQTENPRLKRILSDVQKYVEQGNTLADAMSLHPKVFSELFVNMVRAGEASGALEIVLIRLAEYNEKSVKLRNTVMAALAYPIIMILLMVLVIGALMTFVVPKITSIFTQMGQSLPLYTRIFIGISSFMASYWYIILAVLIAVGIIFYRWRNTEKGRTVWDHFVLRIPIFGRIAKLTSTSRFTRTLATLLNSGIPVLKAFTIVADIVNNKVLEKAVIEARDAINKGSSIAEPLRDSKVFPPIVTHMIAIGEKTGELEEMLKNVAEAYDNEVDSMITALTSVLEPILIVFMAAVIFFMIIAILMPIFQMNQLVR